MVTGAPFQAGVPISAAELNKKTITYSDDIVNETALPGQVFVANVDQGAWQKNDMVMRNLTDDGWVLVSQSRHTHSADTNASGGLLSNVFRANIASFISFDKLLGFGPSDLYTYGSATATIALDLATGAVKLDTINTANNYLVSKVMGVSPSLKVPSTLKTKMQYVGAATNVFVRWGMNMEPMDVSNDTTKKYGIESCPAVNGNWNIVTADGTTRTAIDAGAALEGSNTLSTDSNARSHTLDFFPGSMLNYYYQTNAVVSKSTQLPPIDSVPRSIPATNVCNFGLKTADTNAKQLYIWGLAIFAGVDDPAWRPIS
jgi:hypothetical protein